MKARLITALIVVTVLSLRWLPTPVAADTGAFTGALPSGGGFALVVWGGGLPDNMASAASTQGCTLTATWAISGGGFVGYIFGAPPVVNSAFLALYPAAVPANTALIAVCAGPVAAPTAGADAIDVQLAQLIFAGLNSQRVAQGLPPLADSPILDTTAAKFAPLQLANGALNHELGGQEPWDRAQAQGYPSGNVAEILASLSFTGPIDVPTEAAGFVQEWMASPPHRAIILGQTLNATELGVGCAHGTDATGLTSIYCVGMTGIP